MTQTPQAILDLVERFARNIDLYRSPSYNEAQGRQEGNSATMWGVVGLYMERMWCGSLAL